MSIPQSKMTEIRDELRATINDGDIDGGVELAQKVLGEGITPVDFFLGAIQPELSEVGKRFERLEIFLPELMQSAKVVKAMHEQVLEPAILEQQGETAQTNSGTVVIGTVQGDLHDIGKSIVGVMLQVSGYKVIDLGTDVSSKQIIEEARKNNADIIAMSSLLTPSMPYMRDVIEMLKGWELRDQFIVLVGGAPISLEYAQGIGSDGFGNNAVSAVTICNKLMERKQKGLGIPALAGEVIS